MLLCKRRWTMSELMLDVGQANELKLAFRRAGWTSADIKKLCEGDLAAKLLPAIKGSAQIVTVKHVIDCDANPYVPDGWKVESHKKGGQLEWDQDKIQLYLSEGQKLGKYVNGNQLRYVNGNQLRKELENQPVLNANVLDWLLEHQELIPEEWKGKYIFFWGTIYRDSDGGLCVRCLCFGGGSWGWACGWLGAGFRSCGPVAVAGK